MNRKHEGTSSCGLVVIVLLAFLFLPACKALQQTAGDGTEPITVVQALQDVSAQLKATQAALAGQAAADPNSPAGKAAGQVAAALGTGQAAVGAATTAAEAVVAEAAKPVPDYGPVIQGAGVTIAPLTGPAAPWVLLGTTLLGGLVSIVQTIKKARAVATTAKIVTAIEQARVIVPALGTVMAQDATKAALAANMDAATKATVDAIKGT